jgi:hypothetical protein
MNIQKIEQIIGNIEYYTAQAKTAVRINSIVELDEIGQQISSLGDMLRDAIL